MSETPKTTRPDPRERRILELEADLRDERRTSERTIRELREENANLKDRCSKLDHEMDSWVMDAAKFGRQADDLRKRVKELEAELREATDVMKEANVACASRGDWGAATGARRLSFSTAISAGKAHD